jgi:hypothetical protein
VTEPAAPTSMPDKKSLVWLLVRWLPAALMVSLLTAWSLVMLGDMARVIGWTLVVFVAPSLGFGIGALVAIYALARRRVSRPMIITWLLMLIVLWPGLWERGILALPYPGPKAPIAQVRVPADRAMRVYWGGDELDENYHALYPDQRYAYDLVIEPAGVGTPNLEDYGCYGTPVLAPAAGQVVVLKDKEPEATPGELSPTENYAGNHLWIELADHTYLLLAHLQPGSFQVTVNATVAAGQPLARCGNSGRTSEPHLHLHHQRQDPRTHPLGFAEGLPLEFIDLIGPARPKGGAEMEGDKLVLKGDIIQPVKTSTTPANQDRR